MKVGRIFIGELKEDLKIDNNCCLILFWGHIQWSSGLIPSSVFRDCFWQCWDHMGAEGRTWVSCVHSKHPSCYVIALTMVQFSSKSLSPHYYFACICKTHFYPFLFNTFPCL